MSVKRTFRLTEENADKLRRLADERGTTATEIINAAISTYGTEQNASNTISGDCHTGAIPDGAGNDVNDSLRVTEKAVQALTEQLASKDRQIEGLTDALRAAQTLHAVSESKAIESTDQKRSRWRRLVDAWRG